MYYENKIIFFSSDIILHYHGRKTFEVRAADVKVVFYGRSNVNNSELIN